MSCGEAYRAETAFAALGRWPGTAFSASVNFKPFIAVLEGLVASGPHGLARWGPATSAVLLLAPASILAEPASLWSASANGDVASLSRLLQDSIKLIDQRNAKGFTMIGGGGAD